MPGPPNPTDERTDVEVRRDVATRWLDRVDADSETWQADLAPVTMTLVDALLHGDAGALQELSDPLRDALATMFEDQGHAREIRGYLLGVLEAARWGLRRLPEPGAGTPHARMRWFWERMRQHEDLIAELTGWSPVSSTYRFEAAIADAFDKLARPYTACREVLEPKPPDR